VVDASRKVTKIESRVFVGLLFSFSFALMEKTPYFVVIRRSDNHTKSPGTRSCTKDSSSNLYFLVASCERKDGEEKDVFAQKHFRLCSIFYAFVRRIDNQRLWM